MKLLVTAIDPPQSVGTWSGIPHHLCQFLGAHFELCFVGGLNGPAATLHVWKEKFYRRLGWGFYRIRSEPAVLKEFAGRLEEAARREKPDAILAFNFEPVAYLKPGLPVFVVHDATFRLLVEGYPHFQALCARSFRTGEEAQKRAFARATAMLPASQWARTSVCQDYGVPETKVEVIPMGANLLNPPSAEAVSAAIEKRLVSKQIDFLFVGVEWQRKGGDTAVSMVEALNRRGLEVKLHVVGCTPPEAVRQKPFVVAHGFLSKKKEDEAAKLWNLFETSRFFILPSQAECYGCVFCEAEAFGLPCISRAVGGIPEIIKSGETGFLLSQDLPESELVERAFDLVRDPERYRQMAQRARADYENRLNWEVYARHLKEIVVAHLEKAEAGVAG